MACDTYMLFDSFKDDMAYKYGWYSNAHSIVEEVESDKNENAVCDICGFEAKIKEVWKRT